jgi:hypothetical protein
VLRRNPVDISVSQSQTVAAHRPLDRQYLVQLPPYDAVDRITSLKTRMAQLLDVVKGQQPIGITPEAAAEGLPTAPWTMADYKAKRLDDQIAW